jgi:hypothetical protein
MNKTTIETITRKQVRKLRAEAVEAGDERLCATCDLALASEISVVMSAAGPVVRVDPPESAFAWLDCLNAIRNAEAQAQA